MGLPKNMRQKQAAEKKALAHEVFGLSTAADGRILSDAVRATDLKTNFGNKLAHLLRGNNPIARKPNAIMRRLERARTLCREEGNPFPLVACQWPELLITDRDEAKHFGGEIGNPRDPCLRIDYWQRDILASFFDIRIREVFVKGCVGAGKGTSSSMIFNLAYDVWENCRIILTSTTHKHAKDTIFAEVIKWRRKMSLPMDGKELSEGIARTPQHQILVSNPLNGEAFSGKHGEMIVFGFDEASGVPRVLYTNSLNQFHKIVALSNPRTQHGWFYDGFKLCRDQNETQTVQGQYGKRRCVTVSGMDCLNIVQQRLETPVAPRGGITVDGHEFREGEEIPAELLAFIKPLIPNQSDLLRYRGLLADPDPREIDVKAHGKFPTEDVTKQVILASWLPYHEAAHCHDLPVDCFGLDVAAFYDANVLTAGGRDGLLAIHRWANPDAFKDRQHTMKIVAWTLRVALEQYGIELRQGRVPIVVDMDGIGKGVGDRLEELGVWVIAFQGNSPSEVDPRRYANLRAEAYGELGRRLDNHGPWGLEPWALPTDEHLSEDLCAPEKIYDSSGERFHLTPKSKQHGMPDGIVTVKEKLGRSPDTGDSTVYLFHGVRKLDLWSSSRAAASAPLTVSPAPPGISPAPLDSSVGSKNPETQQLLDYLRGRYS